MWIFIAVFAVLGGGAAWYFKIYRPKHQGAGASEYEPPTDEEENALDDWDETDGGDGGENGDAPPWNEEEADE
jgi:hypothetical protein